MNKFDASGFGVLIYNLKFMESRLSPAESNRGGDDPITGEDRRQFELLRRRASELCQYVKAGETISVIRHNLESLTWKIISELSRKNFLFIADDRLGFLDNEALLGKGMASAFPNARTDIIEAGNCLAAECNTAAVFHLMRVVEHGLRVLAKRVKVKFTHKKRPCQVEFADWEQIISGIQSKIQTIRALAKGSARKEQLQLWSDAAARCAFMRDIWRNDLSHAGKPIAASKRF